MYQKGFTPLIIPVVVLVLTLMGGGLYFYTVKQVHTSVNSQNIIPIPQVSMSPSPVTSIAQSETTSLNSINPCSSNELSATYSLQGIAGSEDGNITYTNNSRLSCYLEGYPKLKIKDTSGGYINLNIRNGVSEQSPTPIRKIVLQSKQQAASHIFWSEGYCGIPFNGTIQISITLPISNQTIEALPDQHTSKSSTSRCNDTNGDQIIGGYHDTSVFAVDPFTEINNIH